MIGFLIISHGDLGNSLIHCANHVMGGPPVLLKQLGVTVHDDPLAVLPKAQAMVRDLLEIFLAPRLATLPASLWNPARLKSCPELICRCWYVRWPIARNLWLLCWIKPAMAQPQVLFT
jgi:hypothetical protein